jgi:alpha-D-ribose 1-methylphosphonate 5-triphosphate synthase subunit PhnH
MRKTRKMESDYRRHQKNYRSLLQALSRPGRLVRFETLGFVSSWAAALAVAECLLDPEVSYCVIGNGNTETLRRTITSATGARLESLEVADFVFVAGTSSHGGVHGAKRGTLERPEEGATIVYCLDSQPTNVSDRFRVRLSGPGIAETGGITPEMGGIPVVEFRALMAVNDDYPLGIDAFFIRPSGEVMGLPRSTRILVR